ncbi:CpaF family protein [Arthrobacter cryoconiti]|uniref:CpaF family protein n=1 Tax=Arthrobacter cryoconiti TaxID=748907 RepID=A0ABV8R4B9_9MICC|nr:ATPase, T2SS/T4P/T4SS family [Arthrobacter cryoconiti]MCC9069350.1 Flp pilus assembly complex ATPase component TadA [Arthrobacter cryoconiti]
MSITPDNVDLFKDLPLALPTTPPAQHPAAAALAAAGQRNGRRVASPAAPSEPVETPPQKTVPTLSPDGDAEIDPSDNWEVVERLANEISEIRGSRDETPENRDELGRAIIATVLADFSAARVRDGDPRLTQQQHNDLQQILFNQAYRMGAVQPLLDDPTIENIHINGCDEVIVRRADGTQEKVAPVASSDQALIEMVQTWCDELGEGAREFNAKMPQLSMTLASGDRLQAAHPPIAPRPTLTIRCHRIKEITLDELVERYGTLTQDAADFLAACVRAHMSVVVSGHPGAGKTTFTRALCANFDPWEPVVTIETERELHLGAPNHFNVKSLEARPGQGERDPKTGELIGSITVGGLIPSALRFDAQRIIVGEVRGPEEILAMLAAMTGAAGSMTTIHAKTAKDAISKMADLQQQSLGTSPAFAYRQIQDHIQIIVQLSRPSGKKRHITEIAEVVPSGDGESPGANPIFLSPKRGADAIFTGYEPHDDFLEELAQVGYHRDRLRGLGS